MKPYPITQKQIDILLLLYRYRFLNRIQIQNFLNHKEPRRIKTWLKDLTDKNIINRIYSQKLGENNKPAIYYLANKCRQILKEQSECNEALLNRTYREKLRSQNFINHSIFIADIYFYLASLSKHNNSQIHFYTQTDLSTFDYILKPIPHVYVAVEDSNKTIKRYFIEVIDEKVPRFALRKRITQYIEYYQSKQWEDKTKHPFPSILLICPTETTKNYLNKHIASCLEDCQENINFFLTLKSNIMPTSENTNIWEKV